MSRETKWPHERELKQMRKKLSRTKGSYGLPPHASALDKAKYEACRQFVVYMRRHTVSQRELAVEIGIPETRVSEIVHYRIWKFTLDRLINYYEKLHPKMVLKIA